jgi:hypothetical protein
MTSMPRALLITAAALLPAGPGFALDGGGFAAEPGASYYEIAVEEQAVASSDMTSSELTKDGAASGGLPSSLYVVDAEGAVTYRALGDGSWEVAVEVAERPHERVDAVYDLVLALPLPVGSKAKTWRIVPKASGLSSTAIVYGGEPIVLKRNVPLERSWLPLLAGAPGGLPDLSRSGYAWTFWDAIVRYDAGAGATVQAYGAFRYQADPRVVAPDADNPDNAAYVITWIPTLEAVSPFAIRLDVVGDEKE